MFHVEHFVAMNNGKDILAKLWKGQYERIKRCYSVL